MQSHYVIQPLRWHERPLFSNVHVLTMSSFIGLSPQCFVDINGILNQAKGIARLHRTTTRHHWAIGAFAFDERVRLRFKSFNLTLIRPLLVFEYSFWRARLISAYARASRYIASSLQGPPPAEEKVLTNWNRLILSWLALAVILRVPQKIYRRKAILPYRRLLKRFVTQYEFQ